jgi:hypothetical protein
MLDHFCSQLVQLQGKIAARPVGKRVPKSSEVERQRKLLNCIIRMKDYPTEDIKYFASRINTVSDEVFDDEETQTGQKEQLDPPGLGSLYIAYQGQEEATDRNRGGSKTAILPEAGNEKEEPLQVIDNEHDEQILEEAGNHENDPEAAKNFAPVKYDSTAYVPKQNVRLPGGCIWLQKGDIYDPGLQQIRRMTPEEWDILLGLGLNRRDFEGWCIAMPG